MLFLTFGHFFLSTIQYISDLIRCRRYSAIMQRFLRTASIFVQRSKKLESGTRLRTSYFGVGYRSRSLEFEDDYIEMYSIQPLQVVDLSSWTAYSPYLDSHLCEDSDSNVCILMEARRPQNLSKFVNDSLRIPPARKLHVLTLGCPIAWKTTEPFGIILHCSLSSLLSLTDAFGQGWLTLDEDLELLGFTTVEIQGVPQNLVPYDASSPTTKFSNETLAPEKENSRSASGTVDEDYKQIHRQEGFHNAHNNGLEQTDGSGPHDSKEKTETFTSGSQQHLYSPPVSISGHKEVDHTELFLVKQSANINTCTPESQHPAQHDDSSLSNQQMKEALNIHATVANGDILQNNYQSGAHDAVSSKSEKSSLLDSSLLKSEKSSHLDSSLFSGQEIEHSTNVQLEETSEVESNHRRSNGESHRTKPPNILVYCGLKDSARKFAEVKASLEMCINTETYTIYHLKHENVLSTPWRQNTALLVVSSCPQLRPEVQDEMKDFVLVDGGALLSFNSSVEDVFVHRSEEPGVQRERLVTFKYQDGQEITSVKGRFLYSDLFDRHVDVLVPHSHCVQADDDTEDETRERSTDAGQSLPGQNQGLVLRLPCENGGVVVLSQLLLERDPTGYGTGKETFAALKLSNTNRLAVLRDILSSLGVDTSCGPAPELTHCHLLAQRVGLKDMFLESLKLRLKDGGLLKSQKMSLRFVEAFSETPATATLLPVVTDCGFDARLEYFHAPTYWKHLRTLRLGQLLFYTDVITSTMSVFDAVQFSIPEEVGVIAVAGRQTSGKGRGGNSWLSPAGCAMFTLPLRLSLESELGQRVSFLQHIVSLAVVHAVLTLPGYEDLDIKLKWPNDIYYGRDMKLGGVLVTSTIMDRTIYATIGCGFNVSNSNPTICINDIIQMRNLSSGHLPELALLSPSQLIARTLNCLEDLLLAFDRQGHRPFCELYYQHWLHGNTKVRVQLEVETEGVIQGLDEFGFLSVSTPEGVVSVQPDGNSFDMMHNLIHFKTQP